MGNLNDEKVYLKAVANVSEYVFYHVIYTWYCCLSVYFIDNLWFYKVMLSLMGPVLNPGQKWKDHLVISEPDLSFQG